MTDSKTLRVLVVDDTVVFRKIVGDVLTEMPDIEVVGTASNGKIAVSKIVSLEPDLLILDIEMPEMDGLEVLKYIKTRFSDVGAIVLSSLTQKGGDITLKALELGAFDFVLKPQDGTIAENKIAVEKTLTPMLKAFARRNEIKKILKGAPTLASKTVVLGEPRSDTSDLVRRMRNVAGPRRSKSEIVGIGISTGGPNALAQILPRLPHDVGVPILIVQHMPAIFTQSLANSLDSICKIDVKEAVDGQKIEPNVVLIAPGGKQMKVVACADGKNRIVRVTNDLPENNCKPSIDYLFRSIAYHYVGRSTGVIMTGMGSDGNLGLKLMKRNGATIIAQDEASSVVFGMAKKPIETGVVDIIAPLNNIIDEIYRTLK
ncbi:MAG: chemotaxis response regulator protein-glutamate methylesterase [Thermodesulfobacteriota bacterium]|nr:chemotaxis response regulator protein-glutamate methylesterase [Thermodesulfobacteriota bacterium]